MKNGFLHFKMFLPFFTVLIFFVCGFVNSGCSKNRLESHSENGGKNVSGQKEFRNPASDFSSGGKTDLKIVCSIFPIFDWTREISSGVENLEIILIQKNGSDLHNFKPSAKDLIEIGSSDLFVFVGGESDIWIENINVSGGKKLCLFDLDFPKITETEHEPHETFGLHETSEPHELSELHKHFDSADALHEEHEFYESHLHEGHKYHELQPHELSELHEHFESHRTSEPHENFGFDEHVWLSLKNAEIFVDSICRSLCEIVPEKSEIFAENAASYKNKLKSLDEKFSSLFDFKENENLGSPESSENSLNNEKPLFVFCDRFPFAYFARDYGLECVSAFSGCSAESEASFERILFLVEKLKSAENAFVFVLENSDRKLAETVIGNSGKSGLKIYELDSMQSVKENDIKNGETYLSLTEKNYEVFEKANLSKQKIRDKIIK